MTPALRENLRPANRKQAHQAGLILQRYLTVAADGSEDWPKEKSQILKDATATAQEVATNSFYKTAFDRWKKTLPETSKSFELHSAGRLIVGLGSENVLETGIRLHHNYGLPLIPGSAIKGLAAHYCHTIYGADDPKFKTDTGEYHRTLFGTTDESGCILFHDAWYVPNSSPQPLVLDVMTPHHFEWNNLENPKAPTDFDKPKPVPFLSATGNFLFAMAWHGPESEQSEKWLKFTLEELLKPALKEWGIGGKTSSGYGRFGEATAHVQPGGGNAGKARVGGGIVPPASATKRTSGTKTKVKIAGTRAKGGFDVQEEGRPRGTLTLGSKPIDVNSDNDAIVEVEVHNDDPKTPQYKWPTPLITKKNTPSHKR